MPCLQAGIQWLSYMYYLISVRSMELNEFLIYNHIALQYYHELNQSTNKRKVGVQTIIITKDGSITNILSRRLELEIEKFIRFVRPQPPEDLVAKVNRRSDTQWTPPFFFHLSAGMSDSTS